MWGLVLSFGRIVFPGGRLVKLIKSGANITESTSPVLLTKNITLTVIDCCNLPPVRFAAHCISAGALITASIVFPNLVTLGSTIHIITKIYEQC